MSKSKAKKAAKKTGSRPFASKAQARLFFANKRLRKYAKKKAHATGMHSAITKRVGHSPAYRALPARKSARRKARGIKK
ncbi:hypothetical protein SEA_LEOPARD_21 [Mycobacterium phage Leopard]|uniref:Uncharacterized protein n=1 Tax=Mycobacterium phage Onyinye TaxID=2686235 RepID=A0A6B9LD00_9CAUD|nr:hypothetical protein PP339_gp022 [Mycobacterium phage Onyinye]QHB37428.1 hypothetical protein SEA_ONYINYE_22 [Mycobacterium phage Onyinye]UOW92899.1 hypothetical protein SEA_LEOPARD_21 [Mycobacterium phage Leopard]WKW85183.1 hypothetical protein SEA_AIKOY__21 [Mycobacterium phage Aikoy]